MSGKTGAAGRPREFKPDAVLEAAMILFWQRGFEATSMQALQARTGLSRSSLYNSFGSKRQLFERAMARYDVRGRMVGGLRDGARGLDDIHVFFDGRVAALRRRHPARGCFMVNNAIEFGGKDAELARAGRLSFARVQRALAAALRRAAAHGEIAAADIDGRARVLLAIAISMNVQARAGATGKELESLAEAAHAQIRAWRSRPAQRRKARR